MEVQRTNETSHEISPFLLVRPCKPPIPTPRRNPASSAGRSSGSGKRRRCQRQFFMGSSWEIDGKGDKNGKLWDNHLFLWMIYWSWRFFDSLAIWKQSISHAIRWVSVQGCGPSVLDFERSGDGPIPMRPSVGRDLFIPWKWTFHVYISI